MCDVGCGLWGEGCGLRGAGCRVPWRSAPAMSAAMITGNTAGLPVAFVTCVHSVYDSRFMIYGIRFRVKCKGFRVQE